MLRKIWRTSCCQREPRDNGKYTGCRMGIFRRRNAQEVSDVPLRRQRDETTRQRVDVNSNRFRLGRTLVGTTSKHVMSAAEHISNELLSSRVHAHELAQRRRRIALLLSIICGGMMVVVLFLMQLTARPDVSSYGSQPLRQLDQGSYVSTLNEYFSKHPLERIAFIRNNSALLAYISDQHPEVSGLRVSGGTIMGRVVYSLEMRKPVAGWSTGGVQYYVDNHGVAFRQNYFEEPSLRIVDNTGISTTQSTAIASNKLLSFIGKTVAEVGDRGYEIDEMILPVGTTRQVDVRLKSIPSFVKMSVDRGVKSQVSDMIAALAYFERNAVWPEYIDIRAEGKAFYR